MQSKCAVFRTEKTLKEGVEQIRKPYEGMNDISVKDKSLLFNTDLVETLEFDNLISQALTTMDSAYNRKEAEVHTLEKILLKEMIKNFMKHTLAWQRKKKLKSNIEMFILELSLTTFNIFHQRREFIKNRQFTLPKFQN